MNWLSIMQFAMTWGPTIKGILDEATSNESAVTKITSLAPTVGQILGQVGGELFPKAAPTLHVLGGAIAAFDGNTTKWLQGAINQIMGTHLKVDGIYGPNTRAAVEAAQQKLGLKVDGLAGNLTQAAIQGFLSKVPQVA